MMRLPDVRPLLYAITDRRALPNQDAARFIDQAVAAGIDLIQIRERDLETRPLLALARAAVERARRSSTRILINDRLDVALAVGAHGVHLPAHGFPVADVRQRYPDLLIGASCHNRGELCSAQEGGADFAVFGPVYETPSKKPYGPPLGVKKLADAVTAAGIPVLALGGITLQNASACLAAGAAGLAAISLFQTSADLAETLRRLRALPGTS